MNYNIFILMFAYLLGTAAVTATQSSHPAGSTDDRIEALEEKVRLLEEQLKIRNEQQDAKFANKSTELDTKVAEMGLVFREEFFWAKAVAIAGGSVSVLAVVIAIISFARKLHKIAEQKAGEKFDALFSTEKDKLIALIKQQDAELQLKESKNLVVLHEAEVNLSFPRLFFVEMGFKKVNYSTLENYEPHADHDLIFFYDEFDNISETTIQKLTKRTPSKSVCFYFGKKYIKLEDGQRRFTFANARTQLYGNLMNALRYQKLLQTTA